MESRVLAGGPKKMPSVRCSQIQRIDLTVFSALCSTSSFLGKERKRKNSQGSPKYTAAFGVTEGEDSSTVEHPPCIKTFL